VRPRYLEVDRQGVVFNMWYLAYFDDAIAAYLATLGHPYPDLLAGGHDVMLVHTELDWSGALRYGDRAEVRVVPEAVGRTSFTLRYDVLRDGVTLCRARAVYVVVATDDNGKRPVPDWLRAELLAGMPDPRGAAPPRGVDGT
jgi:acyl-CoA thioester hydrolase